MKFTLEVIVVVLVYVCIVFAIAFAMSALAKLKIKNKAFKIATVIFGIFFIPFAIPAMLMCAIYTSLMYAVVEFYAEFREQCGTIRELLTPFWTKFIRGQWVD